MREIFEALNEYPGTALLCAVVLLWATANLGGWRG